MKLVIFVIFAMLLATVALNPAAASSSLELKKEINISNNPSHSIHPNILVLKEHVYVAWMDGDDTIPIYDIYFKASHNYGRTFGPAVKLSGGAVNHPPLLAAFATDVYVAWTHEDGADATTQFRASHDHGKSFDNRKDLGESTASYSPLDIAAYDNNVYVVFDHVGNVQREMILMASHDRGVNFDEPLVYSKGLCSPTEPHVAAWKNHVYVTAQDPCEGHPDLLFRASHNNGTSFSKPLYLGDDSQQVKIASKGKFVYLVWNENTDKVNFRVSNDYGRTFSSIKTLNGNVDVFNPYPDIVLSGSNDLYITWQAELFLTPDDVNGHVFFIASHDNGGSFGPLKRLDTNLDNSVLPKVAAAGSNVYVVWQNRSADSSGGSQTLFKRSDDGGAHFGQSLTFDDNAGNSLGYPRPDIAAAGNRVYISWWRDNGVEGHQDVLVRRGIVSTN